MDNVDKELYMKGRKHLKELRNEFEGDNLEKLNDIIDATTLVTYKQKGKILKLLKDFSNRVEDKKENKISSVFYYFERD